LFEFLSSPSKSNNGWILGYSAPRLGVAILVFGCFVSCGVWLIRSFLSTSKKQILIQVQAIINQRSAYFSWLTGWLILGLGNWIALWFLPAAQGSPFYFYYLNLFPFFRWLLSVSILTITYLLLHRYWLEQTKTQGDFESAYWVIAIVIFFLGFVLRIIQLAFFDVSLPFKAGGLFVEFSRQIALNGFTIPISIPYYGYDGNVPFAYSPIPFYLLAVLIDIFHISKFVAANLLSNIVSVISLSAFYFLTREIKTSPQKRLAAFGAYAFMPVAFFEQTESAGLAEAFGGLAIILFAWTLLKIYQTNQRKFYLIAGLAWSFCIMASPGSALGSNYMFLVFVLGLIYRDRWHIKLNAINIILLGLVAVVFSSPYWGTVIAHHGLEIIVDSMSYQNRSNFLIQLKSAMWRNFNISGAPVAFLWNTAIVIGILLELVKRQWILLLWTFLFVSIPSEGIWLGAIPLSLVAGFGIGEIGRHLITIGAKSLNKSEQIVVLIASIMFLIGYLLVNPFMIVAKTTKNYNRANWIDLVTASEWVKINTPTDSTFVVWLDNNNVPDSDDIIEWIPHLLMRQVLNVIQGTEFEPQDLIKIKSLVSLLNKCNDFGCIYSNVRTEVDGNNLYLLVDRQSFTQLSKPANDSSKPFVDTKLLWKNSKYAIVIVSPLY